MGGAEEKFVSYGAARGLESIGRFSPGPVTPLLAKGGVLEPALRGRLPGGAEGVLARYRYQGFAFAVVYAEMPESQAFVPRLVCERKGRITDTTHYGMELRHSRLWTESEALNQRYEVTTSPFQDPNWLRQLFAPSFVDWLATVPPQDFSFELAYGSLLCSIEDDEPDDAGLEALCEASSRVALRIREESRE